MSDRDTRRYEHNRAFVFLLAPNRDSEHQWRRLPSRWHVRACASTQLAEGNRNDNKHEDCFCNFLFSGLVTCVFSLKLCKHVSATPRKSTNCFFVLQSYIYLGGILCFSLVTTLCSRCGNHLVKGWENVMIWLKIPVLVTTITAGDQPTCREK